MLETIGIIGGFGAYATLDFYSRLLKKFTLDTERNLPHMLIDNNFRMPSRTRALLTGESYDEIVEAIVQSMQWMLEKQVKHIVLVCGTAHCFLPDVYQRIPAARDVVIDMLEALGNVLQRKRVTHVLALAAEGALQKKLYSNRLSAYGVSCMEPGGDVYQEIRYFIECVKQNRFDDTTKMRFETLLGQFSEQNVILGCTEFPVLIKKFEFQGSRIFWDPVECMLDMLMGKISEK